MLEDRQKVKVEYHRAEIAYKKMLSNISHDIKTPMTVILGYLEIMRLNGTQNNEMMQKVESTARRVMELITHYLSLKACCEELEISKNSVVSRSRRTGCSLQEAVDHYVRRKECKELD